MMIAKRIKTGSFRSLDEAALDSIAGGRMKLPRVQPMPGPSGGGGGDPLEAQPWSSTPTYLPF